MTVTEESRYHLHQQLDDAVGEKGATTMMELLPPVGWADVATKRDLDHQTEKLEFMVRAEVAEVSAKVDRVRGELEKAMRHQLTVLLSAMVSIAGLMIALSVYGPERKGKDRKEINVIK